MNPLAFINDHGRPGTELGDQAAADAQSRLRDQFAAAVLPGIYSHAAAINAPLGFTNPDWRKGVASEAYKIADEMLAARNS